MNMPLFGSVPLAAYLCLIGGTFSDAQARPEPSPEETPPAAAQTSPRTGGSWQHHFYPPISGSAQEFDEVANWRGLQRLAFLEFRHVASGAEPTF